MAAKELPKISRNMYSSVLDSFTKLGSNAEKHRIAAGVSLLKHLFERQHANQNESVCKELSYALTRLIRGVGSSRVNIRTGFFSVLVGLLSTFNIVTVNDVLEIVKKELHLTSNISKGEEAEIYTAQILVCGALIHSDLLLTASAEERREILVMMVEAGKKRSFLPSTVSSFLIDLLMKVDETWFREALWPVVKEDVYRSWPAQTLDTLHFLLMVRERFPFVIKGLVATLGTPDVLHVNSLEPLCQLLVNVPGAVTLQHPVYEGVCRQLVNSDLLLPYWECVDTQMAKTSRNKELAALEMLRIILTHITDKTKVPKLLSPLLMGQLMRTLVSSGAKGELADKAWQTFSLLSKTLEGEEVSDKTRLSVLKRLLFHPGDLSFEKYTGTKVVQQVTSQLKADGVKKLADTYRKVVLAKKPKVKGQGDKPSYWNTRDRLFVAHMFTRLLGHQAVQEELVWKGEQLQFLVAVGFLAPQPGENLETCIRVALAAGVKECFFRTLDQRLPRLDSRRLLLSSTVHYIHQLLFGPQPAILRLPLTPPAEQAWHQMISEVDGLEARLKKKKASTASSLVIFHTLFLQMALQLFQDSALAMESLQELHNCYARVAHKKLTKDSNEEEPPWVEVVVDLFMSLLSRDSHLLRGIVGCVFPHLCPHLTPSAVHQILQVLDPNTKQNPLREEDDEDVDESNGEEESDGTDKTESEQGTEDEDFSDSALSDIGVDDNEPINLQLKQAVRQALGTAADTDTESVDVDNIDEEEGQRLDMALSEAFKLLRTSRSDGKKSKKQSKDDKVLTHFRVRVLDLLDTYLGNEPAMALCLDMILPLFDLLEFCIKDQHQKPLEMRVKACLKKLSLVKRFSSTSGVDRNLLADIMSRLVDHGECSALVALDMSESVALCCTFLVRCSQQLVKQMGKDRIVDLYKTALLSYFMKRDSLLHQNMFKSVLQLSWEGTWILAPLLVELLFNPAIRPFRRNQALDLLLVFYRNHRLLADLDSPQKRVLLDMETQLSLEAIKVLTSNKEARVNVKQKFFRGLLVLFQAIWRAHQEGGDAGVDWLALWSAVEQYRSRTESTSDVKSATNRLGLLLGVGITNNKADTRAAEPKLSNGKVAIDAIEKNSSSEEEAGKSPASNEMEDGTDASDSEGETKKPVTEVSKKEKKKRQKKKTRTKANLKKQAREYRNSAMSEGIESGISFAQVDLSILRDSNESGTDVDEPKMKKKGKVHKMVNGEDKSSNDEMENTSTRGSSKIANKRKKGEMKDESKLSKKKKHKM